jgi:pimeloyl-ACP methyl ester carboxylesterase
VPTIVLHGACDEVVPSTESEGAQKHFVAHYERHVIPVAGHFLSREAPGVVVHAIQTLALKTTTRGGINSSEP